MNKKELVDVIASGSGLSKKDAELALNTTLEAIGDTIKKGDKLVLVGFGTFSATKRAARDGRNPQTGVKIKIPAKTVAKFKAGKGLEDKLNS